VAIADIFLKLEGVTGEVIDPDHKGEIEVTSWSWGMESPADISTGKARRITIGELHIVKRVDLSSPTLMNFIRSNKPIETAKLTVRKAGKTPLEYVIVELEKARLSSLKVATEDAELVERLTIGFLKVKVSYTPQDTTGGRGGGTNVFEADAQAPNVS
jgi:type VI secretion system secreted protein Hcp